MKQTNGETEAMDKAHAIASLPKDVAIMRMENENIMALAAAKPRDHESIKRELASQIEAYPSFARDAIYNKPVGKDESGKMQYARGLSIRAAEALAEAYGYNRVSSDVSPEGTDAVKITALFVDYQRGRIWQDAGIVSRFYKNRSGQMVRHSDDRFYNIVVKAEASRRIREVITRSVPPGLRAELMEMAERKIDDLLDDKTVDKIIGQFASKGVTLERLEEHVGRTRKAGWTAEDRRDLLGVWNAIKDGETSVDEAFGTSGAPETPTPTATATGTAAALAKPKEAKVEHVNTTTGEITDVTEAPATRLAANCRAIVDELNQMSDGLGNHALEGTDIDSLEDPAQLEALQARLANALAVAQQRATQKRSPKAAEKPADKAAPKQGDLLP
jgi:hypothetical protein